MGMWSSADLVFGIAVPDDEWFRRPESIPEAVFSDLCDDEERLIDALILADAGLPHDEQGERAETARRALPFTIASHGVSEHCSWILALEKPRLSAMQGRPERVDLGSLAVDPALARSLRDFAARHGIEGEPGWMLCSSYG